MVTKALLVFWALASVSGVEIDGKLGKLDKESSEANDTLLPYSIETSVGRAPLCRPHTSCLLLNLVLSPSSSLVSLVPLVPVLKGKSVVTSIPVVPVVKGKPVDSSLVPLVPVIKGKPVETLVPLVPVIKGYPVTHTTPVTRKPLQRPSHRRTKTKTTTLHCLEVRRYYDYHGRPCLLSYYPIVTTKPERPTTGTVRIYPASRYPSTQRPQWLRPVRPPNGGVHGTPWMPVVPLVPARRPPKDGVGGQPWTPLVPAARPVVRVDGKLGFPGEGGRETADSRVGEKVDGKLGVFE